MGSSCSNPLYESIKQLHSRTFKAFSVGILTVLIVPSACMNSNICTMARGIDIQMAMPKHAMRQKTRTDDDLIYVVQKDKMPLRNVINRSRMLRTLSLWETKRGQRSEYDAESVTYCSNRRLNFFVSLTTTIIGLAMLAIPI